ncbi:MAG: DNA polymerase/3'-5' exonuclease PolX [Spirochaetota bacterium]
MPVKNTDISAVLNRIADYLEIKGDNQFRVRSYRNAARSIENLSRSAREYIDNGDDLTDLPDIGSSMAEKILTLVETGSLPQLESLEKEIDPSLLELLHIEGLGPKKVSVLHKKLHVGSLADLKKALQNGSVQKLDGFGSKTVENIQNGIADFESRGGNSRFSIKTAEEIADAYVAYLTDNFLPERITVAGSYRRRKETVGDIDILATTAKPQELMDGFTSYEEIDRVISHGKTKSSVILSSGMQVDLRIIDKKSYGAALQYFTGSREHGVAVRKIAVSKGLKASEYGIFKGDKQIAGKTEEEFYRSLGLPYMEPELRENRGEIDAAQKRKLPDLITIDDIRGDIHVHSSETDGKNTIKEMAEKAKELGYEYIAITDHSQHVTVAQGMDRDRLKKHMKRMEKAHNDINGIHILTGIEVDILADGSLDMDEGLLSELDVVICSVHYKLRMPEEEQTKRILRAMDNKHCKILGHPTGRMINQRGPMSLDMDRIIKAAAESGIILELNANPDRLDLSDVYCKAAKDAGVMICINTDAHSVDNYLFMKYGIGQARRGWLEKDDVLNTRTYGELMKLLKR